MTTQAEYELARRAHDTLIENSRALNVAIARVRAITASGRPAPKASARYLTILRHCHELSDIARAGGWKIEPVEPDVFSQVVGVPAADLIRLSWRGWFGPRASAIDMAIAA